MTTPFSDGPTAEIEQGKRKTSATQPKQQPAESWRSRFPPQRPVQQISLADLGAAVASILNRHQEFVGRRMEVAGDQPTPQQMVDAL